MFVVELVSTCAITAPLAVLPALGAPPRLSMNSAPLLDGKGGEPRFCVRTSHTAGAAKFCNADASRVDLAVELGSRDCIAQKKVGHFHQFWRRDSLPVR